MIFSIFVSRVYRDEREINMRLTFTLNHQDQMHYYSKMYASLISPYAFIIDDTDVSTNIMSNVCLMRNMCKTCMTRI